MTGRTVFTLALFLSFPLTAFAQQPGEISYRDESVMPDGVVGERIRSIIETLNSNDADRVRRFIEQECTDRFRGIASMDEHVSAFLDTFRRWGGAVFHGIRTYTPERAGETVVILQDKHYDAWRAFVVQLDEPSGHLVAGLRFSDARTPTNVDQPALTSAGVVEQTERLVRRLCEQNVFSGTVLLARDDEVLLTHACGEASKRFHVPNDIDTKFNLGSMNKMFTATAVAQLVERGTLSFEDPISQYVDESWLPRRITDQITIHHLLSHTSGLGSYFNETYWNGSRELYRSVDDFKPLVQGDELAFAPGERYRYSNTGMLLLGVVIESATGHSYFDYIREHIYEPAGMTDSDSYEMDFPVENLAIGYIPTPDREFGWENNLYKHVIKGGPAGGGFSTVGDLHRFARALQRGTLVSKAMLETLWSDHSGAGYGYGFGISAGPAGRVVGHGGGFPGLNANLDIFVDSGYIVAVMANYDQAASPLASRIRDFVESVRE